MRYVSVKHLVMTYGTLLVQISENDKVFGKYQEVKNRIPDNLKHKYLNLLVDGYLMD